MTCVVGIRNEGRGVLLAGDSQASAENTKRMRKDPKTFQLADTIAFAYCGSARFGQLVTEWIEDYLEEPFPPLGVDERRWAIRVFIPALTQCLEEHGHLHRYESNSVVELGDSAFLLAIRDRLLTVEPDMQVSEDVTVYSALGSGEDVAIGSLRESFNGGTKELSSRWMQKVATDAIKASSEATTYVGGPITFVRTVRFSDEERAIAKEVLGR